MNASIFFTINEGASSQRGLWKSDGTMGNATQVKAISGAGNLVNVNGVLYFLNSTQFATQLWKSDGTSAGTTLVDENLSAGTGNLTNLNGVLYFISNNGSALWKSDGTEAGTVAVIALNIKNLVSVNGTLFFSNGTALWKSDGTAAGTVMVKNGYAAGQFHDFHNANGTLYFVADDGINGQELWKSDGTAAGTVLVSDITPGATGTAIHHLSYLNGEVFFAVDDPINGVVLWKSNGNAAGTVLVKDIYPGSNPAAIVSSLNTAGNAVYFSAYNGTGNWEVWKSDGTTAGTVLLKGFSFGNRAYSGLANLTAMNNLVYFSLNNGLSLQELWKSDGTTSGTIVVKNFFVPTSGSGPASFVNVNGILYCSAFSPDRASDGIEVWKSDGSFEGTAYLKNIAPLSLSSYPKYLTNLNNQLIFSCTDGGPHGYELWKSNGTNAGTVLLKDINPNFGTVPDRGSNPSNLLVVNQTLFFSANDLAAGYELWKTDGTEAGTVLVKDINPGINNSNPSNPVNIDGILYFTADNGTDGIELWKSDGTDAGTVLVKNINTGGSSNPSYLTFMDGMLYFRANDGTNGLELWKSDGTTAGTVLVKDINTGINNSDPSQLTAINDILYFSANNGSGGLELWKSDGTAAGTVLVKDINPAGNSHPTVFTKVGNNLLFAANDGTHGNEIWITNATEAGTTLMQDIEPGSVGSDPSEIIEVNGKVLTSVFTSSFGREIWIAETPSEIPVLAPVSLGNPGQCLPLPSITIDASNSNVWVPITDSQGDIVAEIKANGNILGIVSSSIFINDGTVREDNAKRLYLDRNVVITPQVQPSSPVDIRLYIKTSEYLALKNAANSAGQPSGITSMNDIGIFKNNNGCVPAIQASASPVTTTAGNYESDAVLTASISSFSSFYFANKAYTALPLTLLDFNGRLLNNEALLNWKTEDEINTLEFIVERSADGRSYHALGTIASANTAGIHQYSFTDANITSLNAAIVYYRLMQKDIDGRYTYSKIVPLAIDNSNSLVILYPNPVRNKINLAINVSQKEKMQWQLSDNTGRIVKRGVYDLSPGSTAVSIDIPNLSSGIYFMQLNGSTLRQVIKVIKQ